MNHPTVLIPPQNGRLVVITGATGGLGFETALALAGAGAEVVLTGRNADKGRAALQKIRVRYPSAAIRFEDLDLASLASVTRFVERLSSERDALDVLVNNAGVMAPPVRRTTVDGFELQWGTNYLGHFALTAGLLPLLRNGGGSVRPSRVVNVSSIAHKYGGAIHFDDLQWERSYQPWPAYAQSKLAMLIFALELQRRSDAHQWGLLSTAAHPGYARTDLIANGPGHAGALQKLNRLLVQPWVSHSAAAGAQPILFAAISADAQPAAYYGPTGPFELKGPPGVAAIAPRALDTTVAARLWDVSGQLTGAQWLDDAVA